MQPSHGQGQGARGPRRNSESLEQRLQRTHVALQQQGAVSFVGQQGAAAQPYALPPGFPPQGQGQPFGQAQQFAAGPIAPGSQFGSSAVQPQLDRRAFPIAAQRLALQLQPGAAIPQPYAALYPQYPPAYGFMAPGAQWRPGLSQQVPAGFPPQPHLMQAGFAYPAQLPVRPPAQAGRQQGMPGRGRAGRRYNGSRGRGAAQQGAQQYRDMWQEVTQVAQGQGWQGLPQPMQQYYTVEDLLAIVQRLPTGTSAVAAVAPGLGSLDSRACAALLKELSKSGLPHHALGIFDWLQSLPTGHELSRLCDIFTYTTVISLCGQRQEIGKALTLVADMRSRGIMPNIHTYTALINTCIRSGDYTLALDVFGTLKKEGCQPNVVTYNTLIDVYGKMGNWQDAVRTLDEMSAEGWEPEARTYNTAIIACNMCNQSREALLVYDRMQAKGLEPTATTFTALVSAHCKSDNLQAALEVYRTMVTKRQERNIITYSSLIAAADRAGEWEEGLNIWQHMSGDRCHPNLPAYNSAVSCTAQGRRWQQAQTIVEQMKAARFKPDIFTYTALLAAYHPAHKWRQALQVLEQMQAASMQPDTTVYTAVIDLLWCSGIVGAQQRALQLFQLACRQNIGGMEASQSPSSTEEDCLEVHITAPVPSIAVLALYRWLQDAHNTLQAGASAFPELQVLLLIKCWTTVASPQSPMGQQGTDPTFRAPSISPEASSSGPGSAHVDPETSTSPAGAGSTSPEASSFVPGPATISLEPAATSPSTAATSSGAVAISPGPAESSLAIAATSSVPGASSRVADTRSPLAVTNSPGSAATSPALEVRTAPRQRKGSSAGKQKQAASSLPAVAVKVFGPEYDDALIQDAIVRMVKGCGLPFSLREGVEDFSMIASTEELVQWLQGPQYEAALATLPQPLPSPEAGLTRSPMQATLSFLQQEDRVTSNCAEAWKAIRQFEALFSSMVLGAEVDQRYLEARAECLDQAGRIAVPLHLTASTVGDAILLLDRLVCQRPDMFDQANARGLVAACTVLTAQYGLEQQPMTVGITAVAAWMDIHPDSLPATLQSVKETFESLSPAGTQDALTTISATRCLKLYLERMGALDLDTSALQSLLDRAFASGQFVSIQPSLLAAVAVLAYREGQGLLPVWPWALADLTGWQGADDNTDGVDAIVAMMRAFVQES